MPEIVVITGASAGIGRAVVRRFAADGAHVALLARNEAGLEAAAREVRAGGGRALVLPTDVADAGAVEAAAERVEAELGPIDIWINVAMATVFAWFADIEPDEFRRATEVTYLGSVHGVQSALKRMRPRDRGTIVQVGSAMAYQGIPLQSPYCGAKAAVRGMVQSVRSELEHQGSRVHVTTVELPGLNTPQFIHARAKMPDVPQPVAPVYQPEVAADAIHWAAHHRRRQVWVGVPTVYTILGSRLGEWVAQRYLANSAVSGQQTQTPLGAEMREGNLFATADHDEGAHGPFDERSHERSLQLPLSKHRELAWGALAAVVAAGGAAAARARR